MRGPGLAPGAPHPHDGTVNPLAPRDSDLDGLRILVVDGQPVYQRGLMAVLDEVPGWSVVATLGAVAAAMAVLHETVVDVVVLDADLPGAPTLRDMVERAPASCVVVVGDPDGPARTLEQDELVAAIRAARAAVPRPTIPASRARRLTGRELEVARLVAQGCRNREIAASLYIAENTVKNHVHSILDKLGVASRVEVAVLVSGGLLDVAADPAPAATPAPEADG